MGPTEHAELEYYAVKLNYLERDLSDMAVKNTHHILVPRDDAQAEFIRETLYSRLPKDDIVEMTDDSFSYPEYAIRCTDEDFEDLAFKLQLELLVGYYM